MVLHVEGMKCGGCESVVKSTLEAAEGVLVAISDHKLGRVEVDFDSSMISLDEIKKLIVAKGYTVQS